MIKQRLLGGSGLRVSQYCLGTLGFGENKGWGTPEPEALRIIDAYADAGGDFIDTAPSYGDGQAEKIVGLAIKECRERFVVATKYTASTDRHPLAGGNSRLALIRSVEDSLRRLGTDRIDLLWLHFWDGTTPLEEILRGLDDCVSSGKVLYTGLSNTPAWLVSRAATMAELRGWIRPAAIQIEYNAAARDAERELTPMAAALGLGVLAWGPLAAGALACSEGPKRREKSRLPAELATAAAKLSAIAAQSSIPPAQLALAWLSAQESRPIPIIGARNMGQLSQLLGAASVNATPEILSQISAIAPPRRGYPHDLLASSYLRRFAFGDEERFEKLGALRS